MIKRITFDATTTEAGAADAPTEVRPVRVAVCTALPDLTAAAPKHDVVRLEWFTDSLHLERYHAWLATTDPGALDGAVVVADEVVLRGADWLEQRWLDGEPKLKHIALALRSRELTAEEFSDRWKAHAGGITGRGGTRVPIPDEARGLAYVQNHPRPREDGEWAYDAVNEVYFDDRAGLERRIAWFDDNLENNGDELVRESWFLAVREAVLFSA